MNPAASVEVKGWCPGALQAMQSGDGLIVRVRPFCGALALDQARELAQLAGRLGNGHIDLTRRANLQLRGLADEDLPELHAVLDRLGLLDPDAATEAVRNVMVGPLAGLDLTEPFDVRPIARALERGLAADARLHALPAKFGMLVDGGGTVSIAGERADVALMAVGKEIALGIDTPAGTQWLGVTAPDAGAASALAAAHAFLEVRGDKRRGRLRNLSPDDHARVRSTLMPLLRTRDVSLPARRPALGPMESVVGVAAPFGRLEADQLHRLASLAGEAGATELRLSPWRIVYFGAPDGAAARLAVDAARRVGLIVEGDDPVLRIAACPGAPDCDSSSVDTRGDARRLAIHAAAQAYQGSIHVSGCAKGCARSDPSDIVLVGKAGSYWLVRNATTHGAVERMVDREDFPALFDGARDG